MITQIYEAINYDEAKKLSEVGVDFIGVIAGITDEYPGILTIDQANETLKGVSNKSKTVVLAFAEKVAEILQIAEAIRPDIIHVAVESDILLPSDLKTLKQHLPQMEFMRTIPVVGEESIKEAKAYEGIADYLLLDSRSKKTNQLGVTGEVHDWRLSKKIVESVSTPIILAGGIGPDNVVEAILTVKPFGVDSKTKTDKHKSNEKDFKKVKAFVNKAKITNYL